MSAGAKLGKVFGAIGSGLSFVPGPWSAIGMALGAAGGIAGNVAAKREAGQEEEQQTQITPTPPPDASRPAQQQIEPTNAQPQMAPAANTFQPNVAQEGQYQSQMRSSIANLILKGDINDLGGFF